MPATRTVLSLKLSQGRLTNASNANLNCEMYKQSAKAQELNMCKCKESARKRKTQAHVM